MNTYLVSRWGNPVEGPDGKDTNFLVMAPSPEEAGKLADLCLADHPELLGQKVEPFCHLVGELGTSSTSGDAGVIHGPWTAASVLRACQITIWHRVSVEEGFVPWEE